MTVQQTRVGQRFRVARGVALLLLSSCATIPVRATTAPTELPLDRLMGRWHVVATTFPMWRDRCDVTFTYGPRSEQTMTDRVSYVERAEQQVLPGVDSQHPEVPTHFTWRGEGLLSLFASEWDVVAVGPDDAWVVLTFGATLATPAGADIIARSPSLDDETLQQVIRAASADAVTASRLEGLFRVAACQVPPTPP